MARDFADKSAARQWVWERQRSSSSIHVCRLPGTIRGPCSALLEPDTNSKDLPHGQARRRLRLGWRVAFSPTPSAALRYWNMARQRYCRRLARHRHALRVSADPLAKPAAHTRGKPGFLTYQRGFGRETD